MLFHFKDIVKVIRSAGETLEELSKEAPSEDRINATATKFLKSLEVHCATSLSIFHWWKFVQTFNTFFSPSNHDNFIKCYLRVH